jgi:hypothetical protein
MDEQVIRSLVKWPAVPVCHGWLAFDRRGTWRMRNEYAQANRLPGDAINHEGLIHFIERNWAHTESGEWFFQNGPQRVYVDLGYTPFIARIYPSNNGLLLRTTDGQEIHPIDIYLDESGQILITCQLEIQISQDSSQLTSTFEKKLETVFVLLHDHDLELFSKSAQFTNACGYAGKWNWQNKDHEINLISSSEIKKNHGLLFSARNS